MRISSRLRRSTAKTGSFSAAVGALATIGVLILPGAAQAQNVTVTSYDTINGDTGAFHYYDATFNGAGNNLADNTPLTNGLGYLTDTNLPGPFWDSVIVTTAAGSQADGWVGWVNGTTPAPTMTFNFGSVQSVTTSKFWFSNGQSGSVGGGGVSLPSQVSIAFSGDGITFGSPTVFPVTPDNVDPSARWIVLNTPATAQFEQVQFGYANTWVFLGEAQFVSAQGTAAPEPGALALLAAPLGASVILRRRRSAS